MGSGSAALKGAAGGAAAGAALGPWGAAAGGLIGGALGYFSGGDDDAPPAPTVNPYAMNQLTQMAAGAQGRMAPSISNAALDTGYMNQSRAGAYDVANRLGTIASGQQQGAGEMAVNAQVGRANAAQMAAARSAMGANAALAYRNSMRNQMDIGLAGAGQAGAARMQDQGQANAQLGSLYTQLYGQDANVAAQNAQLAQQAHLANQAAQLQQQQMNDAMQIQSVGQMLGWDQQTINAYQAKMQAQAMQPNMLANLLQAGGAGIQNYAAWDKAHQTAGAPTAAPVLSQQYPHGDSGAGPITKPSQVA